MANCPCKPVVVETEPSFAWTEDSNCHYLQIDIPGFEKYEVMVQYFTSGFIKVKGEKLVNENKTLRFEQNFKVPKSSDSHGIKAKFKGGILYITIPKHKVEEKKEPEPASIKEQGVVPKLDEPQEKKEPEPTAIKDKSSAPKYNAEEKIADIKDQGAVPKPEAEDKKKPELVSIKDQDVLPKKKAGEKKELEPACIKDQGIVHKHEAGEKKKLEPANVKDQDVVPKHKADEKKEHGLAGTKDHSVNGTTKMNIHKIRNEEVKKKEDNILGNGQQVYGSKKEEGKHRNAPMSFSEDTVRKWEGEPGYLSSAMEMLSQNKGVIATSVLAFSLGVFICLKIRARQKNAL
ncbi:hypothetical protein L484_007636 [Morus notabilis]|uniref:SHSP domain-containing protein n=1 Tax=Morus notabilis TaxID=981085 RepID=W9QIA9_9ROSA|nr:uncharacterized protein LOC21391030 [Morus notabilis]EXB20728.1 hypothetical protein L484_007636 [Morus notabilis]